MEAPIPELTVVVLQKSLRSGDAVIPEGSQGTVVHVYRDGAGYEIEFDAPVSLTVTVSQNEIERKQA